MAVAANKTLIQNFNKIIDKNHKNRRLKRQVTRMLLTYMTGCKFKQLETFNYKLNTCIEKCNSSKAERKLQELW